MIKQSFLALEGGDWEEYKSTFRTEVKAAEWTFDRMKEAFGKVAKDETRKLSIVQESMIRCTDYLRRIIAPAGEQGSVTMEYLCPQSNNFLVEDNVWWVFGREKHTNWWCAICREKYDWQALGGATRREC